MTPLRRRAHLACALCIGTALCFFLTEIVPMPVPIYYPLLRRWALGQGALPGLGMDYFGRSLVALLGGLVAAALTALGLGLGQRLRPGGRDAARGLTLATAWALTALALCASLYAYKLGGRELTPEPLPPWHQPR